MYLVPWTWRRTREREREEEEEGAASNFRVAGRDRMGDLNTPACGVPREVQDGQQGLACHRLRPSFHSCASPVNIGIHPPSSSPPSFFWNQDFPMLYLPTSTSTSGVYKKAAVLQQALPGCRVWAAVPSGTLTAWYCSPPTQGLCLQPGHKRCYCTSWESPQHDDGTAGHLPYNWLQPWYPPPANIRSHVLSIVPVIMIQCRLLQWGWRSLLSTMVKTALRGKP